MLVSNIWTAALLAAAAPAERGWRGRGTAGSCGAPARGVAVTSGAGIKAHDGFALFPAECQRGLSSVGSVPLAPHADLGWGCDQGWGHGGLQQQGCTGTG